MMHGFDVEEMRRKLAYNKSIDSTKEISHNLLHPLNDEQWAEIILSLVDENERLKQQKLDRDDILSLVKGTSPNYSAMDHPLIAKYGWFNGSLGEWNWTLWKTDRAEYEITEEVLLSIYKICKDSWKEAK